MKDIIITPVPIEDEDEFVNNKCGMTDEEYDEAQRLFEQLEQQAIEELEESASDGM